MTNRRHFLRTVAGTVAGGCVMGLDLVDGSTQAPAARRQVTIGNRRIRVVDIHAHSYFVPPVVDVVRGTPLAAKVAANRSELVSLLGNLKREGKRIAGVSAPAKGMTLLNYCRIGPELLDFVTEKSTLKIGRFTPGTHIPVMDDDALVRHRVDYALLLAWNFAEEIMGNLDEFVRQGGQFIVPVPTPKIISRNRTQGS